MSKLDELIERKRAELRRLKDDVSAREAELESLLQKKEEAGRLDEIRKAAFNLGVNMKIAKAEKTALRFDEEPKIKKKRKGGKDR